jgi:PTS system galactitol-specific IIC component
MSITSFVSYFLSFKSYVVLPVIIFILALIFRMKILDAIKSSLLIGIGFIGIFMCFNYFVSIVNPVVQALITRSGLNMDILDTGWPPLAAVTWSFSLTPLFLLIFLSINIVMLALRWTKTVDIDIWNYWHVIFAAILVYGVTSNIPLTIISGIAAFIIMLKISDWSAPMINRIAGMNGICIPHLSAITHYSPALLLNALFDRIPGFNKIEADPEKLKTAIGIFAEPMFLGLIIGAGLGIGAGYDVKQTSELAFGFSAVVYILPRMSGILGSALVPVSEAMKEFIAKYLPGLGTTYIGLDVAVLFSMPSAVVTAILLMPVSIVLAFILPGVRFIPLGDLTNLLVPASVICVATRGNIVRAFTMGVPMVIANLYIATAMSPLFVSLAAAAPSKVMEYQGTFTSFLDGGQIFRAWWTGLFTLNPVSLVLIPLVAFLLYFTWKKSKLDDIAAG